MNFAQFLKLLQTVLAFAPNLGTLLNTLLTGKTWNEKLAIVGTLIDTILANLPAAKACIEANAVMALDAEQEEALVFETCGLFRRKPAGEVDADAFDGTKLKAIFALLQPFLPLLLKLIGLPIA